MERILKFAEHGTVGCRKLTSFANILLITKAGTRAGLGAISFGITSTTPIKITTQNQNYS